MLIYIIASFALFGSAYNGTVWEFINSTQSLSTLAGAINSTGLVSTLNDTSQNFTILAPNNAAFAMVTVPNNESVLANLLEYHVVSGYVLSSDLSSGEVVTTLQAQDVTVFINGGAVDFFDTNGRVSRVVTADTKATNGVVHIVNSVLLPNGTINNITSNIGMLSDLNGALDATGLNTTLADPTQTLTLFAPTNNAVAAFTGTINENLLLYHVLGSIIFSGDLKNGSNKVPTLDNNSDEINVILEPSGAVVVEDTNNRTGKVEIANIASTNGVVHIIDIVLSPFPV